MSIATEVGQVYFSQKSGVYMPAMMCDKGDLYQEYDGDASNPGTVNPSFAALKPTISYLLSSSRVAEGVVTPKSVEWKFNSTVLTFDTATQLSTNTIAGETGHFKKVTPAPDGATYHGLQIVKDLVKASGAASVVITATATVSVGNTSDNIQCMYSIPITKGVGNQKVVTIMAGDNNFFAIKEKGSKVILKAVARMGASEISSGLSYKWYQMNAGSWAIMATQTAQTLTVDESMVDTTGSFKVEVYQGAVLIGLDTQTVMDLSDPYDIITNPNPQNETIEEGSGGTVVYTPIIVKRGTSENAKPGAKFFFTFTDSAGVILNVAESKVAATSGVCTEAMCIEAGGNVSWIIASED